jgi:hypothetical protein
MDTGKMMMGIARDLQLTGAQVPFPLRPSAMRPAWLEAGLSFLLQIHWCPHTHRTNRTLPYRPALSAYRNTRHRNAP